MRITKKNFTRLRSRKFSAIQRIVRRKSKKIGRALPSAGLAFLLSSCVAQNKQFFGDVDQGTEQPAINLSEQGDGHDDNSGDGGVVSATPTPTVAPTATPTVPPPATPTPTPIVVVTPTPTPVCDPFANGGSVGATAQNGVKGDLFYYDTAQLNQFGQPSAVNQVITNGIHANSNLFFNKIDVPTRRWTSGFVSGSTTLKKANGQTLNEFFAVRFKTFIKLPEGSADKQYQFAILSDDGAKAFIKVPGSSSYVAVVNNDGQHETKMGCALEPVTFKSSQAIEVVLDYYQGIRDHIAVVLLWREWNGSPDDVECEKKGNNRYFNWNVSPSAPTATYNGLLNRGWSVVPADVMYIDATTQQTNPCSL